MSDGVNVYIGAPDGQTAVSVSSADTIYVTVSAGFTGSGGGGGGSTNLSATRTSTTVTVNSDTGTDATIAAADGSNAGVMTSAMQVKLDGIETGAEVNDTASEILTKVLTVDGTGSGLDADLLDGNHASAFAAAIHTHVIGDVTGLQTALDGKAATVHTHVIGDVTGLQTALDGKVDENASITGATKTKITYDAKGLVTAGADATTADIADSNDKRYVTEAEKTKLSNLSGTNTGDQNLFSTIAVSGQSSVVADGTGDTLTLVAGSNVTITTDATTDTITIAASGGGGGSVAWGGITGTLSNQTDLQSALDGKVDENTAITGATKTKITYDAKGLVTAGADATTADIADSTNRRYVTDAQQTVIGNTSGTNTGDQTITLTGDVTGSGTGSFAATIANDSVTNAKLANMATATIKGRTTAGSGDPEDLTSAQATTLLDTFTTSLKGLAPASGGGTTNFLRADGTWAAPSGGGGGGNTQIYIDQTPDNGAYGLLSGLINGTNSLFTVSQGTYVSGTLVVALDGIVLTQGASQDYVETSPASGTFTLSFAPPTGSVLTCWYNKTVVVGANFTSGTASPSGGNDGDIYLQYT